MLLRELETMVETIKSSSDMDSVKVPLKLIELLDSSTGYDSVGGLLISLRNNGYIFRGGYENVATAEEAFSKIKHSNDRGEKLYYCLIFLSHTNKVTYPKVTEIIRIITA